MKVEEMEVQRTNNGSEPVTAVNQRRQRTSGGSEPAAAANQRRQTSGDSEPVATTNQWRQRMRRGRLHGERREKWSC